MDTQYFNFLSPIEQKRMNCEQLKQDLAANDIWLMRKRVLLITFSHLKTILKKDLAMLVCKEIMSSPLDFKEHKLHMTVSGNRHCYVLDGTKKNGWCPVFWGRLSDIDILHSQLSVTACRLCRRPQLYSPSFVAPICPVHGADLKCPCKGRCKRNDVFCKSIPCIDYHGTLITWNE